MLLIVNYYATVSSRKMVGILDVLKQYCEWLCYSRNVLVKYRLFKFRFHPVGGTIVPWKLIRTFLSVTQQIAPSTPFKITDTKESETKHVYIGYFFFYQLFSKSLFALC